LRQDGTPTIVAQQGKSTPQQSSGHPASSAANSCHLKVPGTPEALPQIRELVATAARHSGFSDPEIAKIEMAIDEACSNIIEHAYRHQPGHLEIEIEVNERPDRLEIVILDYSKTEFAVNNAPAVDVEDYLSEHRQRGLGLYIIRSFVDHVEHRFVCGRGNELRLTKFLTQP
jgi:serine/threonine-protein kinase RsbW